MSTPSPKLMAVGIDLGSLHARVAVSDPSPTSTNPPTALPSVVSNAQGSRYTLALSTVENATSSVEETRKNDEEVRFIFGEAARRTLARDKVPLDRRLVRHLSTLSLAGSASSSDDDDVASGEEDVPSEEQQQAKAAASAFLSHLAALASDATSQPVSSLRFVLSVPVNASRTLVDGVVDSAKAGVQDAIHQSEGKRKKKKGQKEVEYVVGVISDPAAVCIAHGLTDVDDRGSSNRVPIHASGGTAPKEMRNVLVIDWGASGLTVTHLRILPTTRILSVVSTRTDASLSGRAIIHLVVKHCASMFERKNRVGGLMESKKAVEKLTQACEVAVRTLSRANSVNVTVDGLYEGLDCNVPISRPRFDMLTGPILRKAGGILNEFLSIEESFDAVLSAGNVAVMPSAKALVEKSFPDAWRGRDDVPPEESVSVGCAMHAAALLDPTREENMSSEEIQPEKRDVPLSPVSIGILPVEDGDVTEVQGTVRTLIGLGAPLPANVSRTIELRADGGDEKKEASAGEEDSPEGDGAMTSLAIVQVGDGLHKVVGRIENIPADARTVEVTLELSRDGKLTMAVNGGESCTV